MNGRKSSIRKLGLLALLFVQIFISAFPFSTVEALTANQFCGSKDSYSGCYNNFDHLKAWGRQIDPSVKQFKVQGSTISSPFQSPSKADSGGRICRSGNCVPLYEPQVLGYSWGDAASVTYEDYKEGNRNKVRAIVDFTIQGRLSSFRWGQYLYSGSEVSNWRYYYYLLWPGYSQNLSFNTNKVCGFNASDATIEQPKMFLPPGARVSQDLATTLNRPYRYRVKLNNVPPQSTWRLCVLEMTDPWGAVSYVNSYVSPRNPPAPVISSFTLNGAKSVSVNPDERVNLDWSLQNAELIWFGGTSQFSDLKDWADLQTEGGGLQFTAQKTESIELNACNTRVDRSDGSFYYSQCVKDKVDLKINPLSNTYLIPKVTGENSVEITAVGTGVKRAEISCATRLLRAGCGNRGGQAGPFISQNFDGKTSVTWDISDVDVGDTTVTVYFYDANNVKKEPPERFKFKGADIGQCIAGGFSEYFIPRKDDALQTAMVLLNYASIGMCSWNALQTSSTGEAVSCLVSAGISAMGAGAEHCREQGGGDLANAMRCSTTVAGVFLTQLPGMNKSAAGFIADSVAPLNPLGSLMPFLIAMGTGFWGGLSCYFMGGENARPFTDFLQKLRSTIQLLTAATNIYQFVMENWGAVMSFINGILSEQGPGAGGNWNLKDVTDNLKKFTVVGDCIAKGTCKDDINWDDIAKKTKEGMEKVGNLIVGVGWDCKPPEADIECMSNMLQVACGVLGNRTDRDGAKNKVKSARRGYQKRVGNKVYGLIDDMISVSQYVLGNDYTKMTRDQATQVTGMTGGCP